MIITYKDLRDSGVTPRVHGNVFIQVDLPEPNCRLHIWSDGNIPKQKIYTGIHNHRFSFRSKILCGALSHVEYDKLEQSPTGFYKAYKAVKKDREDTEMILASPYRYNLKRGRFFFLTQGSSYGFDYGKFHESKGFDLTVTLMCKTVTEPLTEVYVLCEQHEEPDNEFSRYQFKEEQFWPIVKQAFDKIKEIDTTYV